VRAVPGPAFAKAAEARFHRVALLWLFVGMASLGVLPLGTVPAEGQAPEVCDVDGDGDIDKLDLREISRARNQPASGPDDPRDANGDGLITPADVKACIPQCTLPGCEVAAGVDPNDVDDDRDGVTENEGDCDDGDPSRFPGNPEICDGVDNDCTGLPDDGLAPVATSCGVGECAAEGTERCIDGQLVDDCTPGPPAAEGCDGLDNDCNGVADDGLTPVATTCGVGACGATGTERCVDGQLVDDCTPGTSVTEVCDGLDNDCDGAIPADEADGDGDTFRICAGDCDDGNADIHPGATEIPGNDVDENCDGSLVPPNAPPVVQALLAESARPPQRFQTFFGEDLNRTENPDTPGVDDPLRPFSLPNTTSTREIFLRELGGDVGVETFDEVADGTLVTSIDFGTGTATLTSDARVRRLASGTFNGTYPISGETFLLSDAGSVGTLSIEFDVAVGAFGLAVTDAGDGFGQLSMTLVHETGDPTAVEIPHTADAGSVSSGSAFFFGVVTTDRPVLAIVIENSNAVVDGFGMDDLIIARPDQVLSGLFEGETAALAPATFTDAEPEQTHTATVAWPGAAPEPGGLTEAGGMGTITSARPFLDDTTGAVEVCVTDDQGVTGCDATPIEVQNLPPRIECSLSGFRVVGMNTDGVFVELDTLTGEQTPIADTERTGWDALTYDLRRATLFGIFLNGENILASIDVVTGEVHEIGPVMLDGDPLALVEGIAADPVTGDLIATASRTGVDIGDFHSELLVRIDPDTADATLIVEINAPTASYSPEGDGDGLEFVNGRLLLTDSRGGEPFESAIVEIDRTTGTPVILRQDEPTMNGLAYDASTGILYGSSPGSPRAQPGLYRISTSTGEKTLIGSHGPAVNDIAVIPPAAATRLLGITLEGVLYEVDPLTGVQTEIGRNDVGRWSTLTWDPRRRALFSLLDIVDAPALGRIDPATGEAERVGRLTLDGVPIALAEALDFAPDGRLFAGVSLTTGVADGDFYSDVIVEIDPDTGEATFVAELGLTIDFLPSGQTVADADRMVFLGSRMLVHDGIGGLPETHPRFGGSSLFDVDLDTGATSNRVDFDPNIFQGLAADPQTGILYAVSLGEGTPGLYRLSATGGVSFVGPQSIPLSGLAAVPGPPCSTGGLYAIDADDHLLLVDVGIGRGRDLGEIVVPGVSGKDALAFDPVRGTLFATYRRPATLVRIDPTSGAASEVGPSALTTGGTATAVCGLSWNPQDGGLYAIFTQEAAQNPCDRLGLVDASTGEITPLVTLTQAGSAGDFGSRVDADAIEWIDGELYAVDAAGGVGTGITLFYRIDLDTGFADLVGDIGVPGEDLFLFGLAYAEPLGVLFGASSVTNRLVSVDVNAFAYQDRFRFPSLTIDIAFAVPRAFHGTTTIVEGEASSLTLRFTDPGVLDTHIGTIDWGDGTVEPANAVTTAGSGFVGGTHVYRQDGAYDARFCVQDDDGGEGCTTLGVTVFNAAPEIEAIPDQIIDLGDPLDVVTTFTDAGRDDTHTATADWGDGVVDDLFVDPVDGGGSIATSHTYAARGTYAAALCVTDDGGDLGCAAFSVFANGPPAFTSAPPIETVPGAAYSYAPTVEDDPGDTSAFSLAAAPAGMDIDPDTGLVTWTPLDTQLGDQPVTIRVTDARGLTATQTYSLAVVPDTVAPTLSIDLSSERVDPGEDAILTVVADDNGAPPTVVVLANGVPVPLDENGQAVLPTGSSGVVLIDITVTDAAGNTTTKKIALAVTDPTDVTPPVAALASPDDLAEVTYLTDVIGTASDANFFRYRIGLARGTGQPFTLIAEGFSPGAGDVLATLDPTLLENGIYRVRLVAEDVNGAVAVDERAFRVSGAAKVGLFTLTYTDLALPLNGIDIAVQRVYDSRVKETRDFGFGWSLGVARGSFTQNRPVGLGWQILDDPGPLGLPCRQSFESAPHQVEVTLSDRESYVFVPRLTNPAIIFGGCTADVEFELLTGTTTGASLTPLDGSDVFYELGTNEVLNPDTLTLFDPQRVRLTTLDGRVIDLDRAAGGVTRIADLLGNSLDIRADGIIHSSGRSIIFGRDALGRIETITDPEGQVLRYTYDDSGDLVSFADRLENVSSYGYDGRHGLVEVRDPLGNRAIRTEYDAAGRVVQMTDATGAIRSFDYALAARVQVVTDARGNASTYVYDERGNIVEEMDALGGRFAFEFDAQDNRVSESDPLGRVTRLDYDANGNVLTITNDLGAVQTFEYDARGRPISAMNALGGIYRQTYSPLGLLESLVDAEGGMVELGYDVVGTLVSHTDAAGMSSFEVDGFGDVVREVDPLGQERLSTYDANGRRTALSIPRTTPSGPETLTWRFAYDNEGRMVEHEDPAGGLTTTEYDALGRVVAEVDPLGRRTAFHYDERGLRTQVAYADGSAEFFAYDAAGNLVEETDRAGRVTRHGYDALNRRVTTTYPDDTPADISDDPTVRWEYDAAGQLVAEIDRLGNRTDFEYDRAGRRVRTILPAVLDPATGLMRRPEIAESHDATGNLVSTTDPLGRVTSFERDANGRATARILPDGTRRESDRDARGLVVERRDALGFARRFERDAIGRLLIVEDPLGGITRFGYDEADNRVSQTDALGRETRREFDGLGRETALSRPLGAVQRRGYDLVGQLATLTDFDGTSLGFAYDDAGRLAETLLPEGPVTFTYTPTGQVATAANTGGVTQYDYDARDRLVRRVEPDGREIAYVYDAAGRRVEVRTARGTVRTGYDALGRITAIEDWDGRETRFSYDLSGALVEMERPNGTVLVRGVDAVGRTASLEEREGGGALLLRLDYSRDSEGRVVSVAREDGVHTDYEYDAVGRLVAERRFLAGIAVPDRVITYELDAVGNRTERDDSGQGVSLYSCDADDRLLREEGPGGIVDYDYDERGNRIRRNAPTGTTSYRWDSESRLLGVDLGEDGFEDFLYAYDAFGDRVGETALGTETRFLVDTSESLSEPVLETSPDGSILAAHIPGPLRVVTEQDGALHFFHQDALGSVVALSDAGGFVTDSYGYDAFGVPEASVGISPNRFRFAGEPYEPATGLLHLRARSYDPATGRFLGMDPEPGEPERPRSLHRFLYAGADPVNFRDPTGRQYTLIDIAVAEAEDEVFAAERLVVQRQFGQQVLDLTYRAIGEVYGRVTANSLRLFTRIGAPRSAEALTAIRAEFRALVGPLVNRNICIGAIEALVLLSEELTALNDPLGEAIRFAFGGRPDLICGAFR